MWAPYSMPLRHELGSGVIGTDYEALQKWKTGDEEVVVLTTKLTDPCNEFYDATRLEMLKEIDGEKVTNMESLLRLYFKAIMEKRELLAISMSTPGKSDNDTQEWRLEHPPHFVLDMSITINDAPLLMRHGVMSPVSPDLVPLYCELAITAISQGIVLPMAAAICREVIEQMAAVEGNLRGTRKNNSDGDEVVEASPAATQIDVKVKVSNPKKGHDLSPGAREQIDGVGDRLAQVVMGDGTEVAGKVVDVTEAADGTQSVDEVAAPIAPLKTIADELAEEGARERGEHVSAEELQAVEKVLENQDGPLQHAVDEAFKAVEMHRDEMVTVDEMDDPSDVNKKMINLKVSKRDGSKDSEAVIQVDLNTLSEGSGASPMVDVEVKTSKLDDGVVDASKGSLSETGSQLAEVLHSEEEAAWHKAEESGDIQLEVDHGGDGRVVVLPEGDGE